MDVNTLRRLDRWLGTPACLALTAWRRLGEWAGLRPTEPDARLANAAKPADAPITVVIVKLAEMGSTVLALPALHRLREQFPGARFHYVCLAENRSILDILPEMHWEAVHTIGGESPAALLRNAVRTVRQLRRLKPDLCLNLEFFSRGAAALSYLSGARVRVGMHRFHAEGLNCGDLFTHRISYNNHLHTAAAFLSLAEAVISPSGQRPLLKSRIERPTGLPRFRSTPEERAAVLDKLEAQGYPTLTCPPMLILNTNASDLVPLRRWPAERFETLGRRCLAERPELWIALTGTRQEAGAVAQLAKQLGGERVVNMAGQTSLRQLLTLYTLARVMVTNDSGPGHFASLTPMRTIVLFGPETPELYGPLGEHNRALYAGLACSPCIHVYNVRHSPCNDNACMKSISVDEVYTEVVRALAE